MIDPRLADWEPDRLQKLSLEDLSDILCSTDRNFPYSSLDAVPTEDWICISHCLCSACGVLDDDCTLLLPPQHLPQDTFDARFHQLNSRGTYAPIQ
jgi:hypothetical protein